jgi:hypothetical protein
MMISDDGRTRDSSSAELQLRVTGREPTISSVPTSYHAKLLYIRNGYK